SGAAGLVFCSDGKNEHYGFYPSAGKLRLTRFEGPDVFSWHVLREQPSRHYHPGQWNTLRVRLEENKIRCFVNDQLVIESDDDGLTAGKVGLAKFRQTKAEFKNFKVGREVAPRAASPEDQQRIVQLTEALDVS